MNKSRATTSTLRRTRKWVAPFALILATGAGLAVWPTATVMSAVKQALADPQSIFAERSPGERDPGALTQTKETYPNLMDASGVPPPPKEMLMEASPLPTGEDVPKAFAAIVPPDDAGPVLPNSGLPGTPGLIIPVETPGEGPIGPTFPDLPIPGVPAPPPVITIDRSPPNGPDTPVISGVPEPASWATMMVGFLAVGALLRGRSSHRSASNRRPGTG